MRAASDVTEQSSTNLHYQQNRVCIIREVELPAQARRRRSTDTGVAVTTRVQYVMASDESEDDVMQAVNPHMACDNDPAR